MDWSWLAEQQANLFLFAGAFLVVVAALIYVGYSGQAVTGALKVALLAAYTVAFLAAGVVCFRIPVVRVAGLVFIGISAVLVPLNFVLAGSVIESDFSDEGMWLAGSLASAAFYAGVGRLGLGRQYSFAAGWRSPAAGRPWSWPGRGMGAGAVPGARYLDRRHRDRCSRGVQEARRIHVGLAGARDRGGLPDVRARGGHRRNPG
jgi:hypothetical protein